MPPSPEEQLDQRIVQLGIVFPLAQENYINSKYNLCSVRNNPNASIIENINEINHSSIKKVLSRFNPPINTRAVVYNSFSEYSKKIATSYEIKNLINNNYLHLKSGALRNSEYPVEFTSSNDLYAGIQNATIVDAYIDNDGYFNAILIDYYDFELRDYKRMDNLISLGKVYLNNTGYYLQEKGVLDNYVILCHIRTKDY